MSSETLWLAVPAAALAAVAFGASGALQHHATRQIPADAAGGVGMLRSLARQPLWLVSLATNAVAVALQWLALSTAPLVLIQPILVLGIIFAVLVRGLIARRRPDRVVLVGTGLCAAGLAVFLVLAQPVPGNDVLTLAEVVPLAASMAGVLAACLVVAAKWTGRLRVLGLATATGVLFGVTAALAKLTADDLRHGVGTAVTNWPLYAVAVCGVSGFVLSQNAFRVGVAMAPALAVMIALDPLVSIALGALWLGERINAGVLVVTGEVLALGATVAGIAILSQRAPQAAEAEENT